MFLIFKETTIFLAIILDMNLLVIFKNVPPSTGKLDKYNTIRI